MKAKLNFEDAAVRGELLRTLVHNTPVAYIILDKHYKVQFINDYFLKLRKLKMDEVLGERCFNLSNNGVPCELCAVRNAIESGTSQYVLRRDVLPDGTVRYMDDYAIPLKKDGESSFDYILEIMVNRTGEMLLRERTNEMLLNIVRTLVSVLDKKDPYTSEHSRDVSAICARFMKFLGFGEEDVFVARLAGLLHDIGKVYIPDDVINKPARLSDEEYTLIKAHPENSFNMLGELVGFAGAKKIARYHHERWDGKGYPQGLAGEAIPLGARIAAIADTYDAMTTSRSYRKALDHAVAVEEIVRNSGTQFDPFLVEHFVEMTKTLYPTQEALTAPLDLTHERRKVQQIERQIRPQEKTCSALDANEAMSLMGGFDKLAASRSFIQGIFENTPAYYAVVDESFNVLYVSDSLSKGLGRPAEELLGGKCFDINDKKMNCFTVEGGTLKCPVVRAFQTGKEQTGQVVEKFGDQNLYFDIYAVPIELKDENGETVKCAMEILFDRTEERKARAEVENDIRHLIDMLYNLMKNLDSRITRNTLEISMECNSFGEYVEKIQEDLGSLGAM